VPGLHRGRDAGRRCCQPWAAIVRKKLRTKCTANVFAEIKITRRMGHD